LWLRSQRSVDNSEEFSHELNMQVRYGEIVLKEAGLTYIEARQLDLGHYDKGSIDLLDKKFSTFKAAVASVITF
jgi:hypothetical protein